MALFFLLVIILRLSPEQLEAAETEAIRRQSYNEARSIKGRNRAASTGSKALELHRLGCVGEMAVALWLGMVDGVFTNEAPIKNSSDLRGDIDVKTRPKHNRDLLIQLDADPAKIYVLVTHEWGGSTHIVGWIRGKDAMRKEWIREFQAGRPCYAVPQDALNGMNDLPHCLPPEKPLEAREAWITELPDGELLLNFSDDLAERLGWQVGDTLTWEMDAVNCQCIIRKVIEPTTGRTEPEP